MFDSGSVNVFLIEEMKEAINLGARELKSNLNK